MSLREKLRLLGVLAAHATKVIQRGTEYMFRFERENDPEVVTTINDIADAGLEISVKAGKITYTASGGTWSTRSRRKDYPDVWVTVSA